MGCYDISTFLFIEKSFHLGIDNLIQYSIMISSKDRKKITKMTNKRILNEANKILTSLQKLQERSKKLINVASEGKFYIPPHIQDVLNALDDLASFDLEDSIANAYDYED